MATTRRLVFFFLAVFLSFAAESSAKAGPTPMASAGNSYTVALRSDGTLWAWGANNSGQIGDGTNINRTATPVQIGTGTDWSQAAAGSYHTVALKSDGTLWAWGYNGDGALGDGTGINRYAPVQVGTDANWSQVA
ncbi:MAG: hypothetical protein HY894_01995, partial [Deltaproteobacteria bacterium]|nr:hypothetical protein [Deltaproteobacteria bacterium]